MNRRSFLRGAIAVLAAPAIVRAESLMPVVRSLWTPPLGPNVLADPFEGYVVPRVWSDELMRAYQRQLLLGGMQLREAIERDLIAPQALPIVRVLDL